MIFWLSAFAVGVVGAFADVILGRWSDQATLSAWLMSVLAYLVFMTGLGWVIRYGSLNGFRLTVAVILVLVVNVAALALWDSYKTTSFSTFQIIGVVLALAAIACFELGRA